MPDEVDRERYRAEARFCRALAYYVLMDAFANPPFVTEETTSTLPEQINRKDLFNWLEKELTAIRSLLPEQTDEYGRADQHTVEFLLARMYLNAEVYTGTPRYTDCITYCKYILGSNDYWQTIMPNFLWRTTEKIPMPEKKSFSRYWLTATLLSPME